MRPASRARSARRGWKDVMRRIRAGAPVLTACIWMLATPCSATVIYEFHAINQPHIVSTLELAVPPATPFVDWSTDDLRDVEGLFLPGSPALGSGNAMDLGRFFEFSGFISRSGMGLDAGSLNVDVLVVYRDWIVEQFISLGMSPRPG